MSKGKVSQKLTQFRQEAWVDESVERRQRIQALSLEELSEMTIAFGKAKLGMRFPEAFEDHRWTDWFVGQYEDSPKEEHQKFVVYVEKRLDAEAQAGKGQSKGKSMTKTAVKAKAKSAARSTASESSWTQVPQAEIDSEEDMIEPVLESLNQQVRIESIQEHLGYVSTENRNLASRLTQVEMVMNEMLTHLKQLNIKQEP
eukprot:symbB.v1.2.019936.t1/scaffold1645.1/size107836/1